MRHRPRTAPAGAPGSGITCAHTAHSGFGPPLRSRCNACPASAQDPDAGGDSCFCAVLKVGGICCRQCPADGSCWGVREAALSLTPTLCQSGGAAPHLPQVALHEGAVLVAEVQRPDVHRAGGVGGEALQGGGTLRLMHSVRGSGARCRHRQRKCASTAAATQQTAQK